MDEDFYPTISMKSTKFMKWHHRSNYEIPQDQHNSCSNDTASVTSTTSDIDIDDSNIKEEPLSPQSSCPSSPRPDNYTLNVNLANMAAHTNTDLVFEHKVIIFIF